MKNNIHYAGVGEKEKVLKALALAMETGLGDAFKTVLQKKSFTSCTRIEKTTLQAVLKSATKATTALQVCYTKGLTGNMLLLVRMNDLFRLGDMILGSGGEIDDAMSPQMIQACAQFFATAISETNRSFSNQHGPALANDEPQLLNPDGKPSALHHLSDGYEGVLCATFELVVEPKIDSRIQVLFQSELLQSLMALLPDYEGEPQVISEADKRRAMHKTEEQADEVSMVPAPDASAKEGGPFGGGQKRSDRNWNIDLLLDVELPIVVSFGETEMQLKDVLKFSVGSIIELNKSVNDPVVIMVNQKPIARGEVVMVDGNYGVRILDIESTAERLRSLG